MFRKYFLSVSFILIIAVQLSKGYWPPRQDTGRSETYVDRELEAAKANAVRCDCPKNVVHTYYLHT